jgi:alkylation response protein AidB-like acyl-CoA dehydrogenase
MELQFTAEEQSFRDEVRAFFAASLPDGIRNKQILGQRLSKEDIVAWQRILNKKGWVAPNWPVEYGGTGWDAVRYYIFREESYRAWAPDPLGFNINLVGPVICAFGTEAQKKKFLPAVRNLDIWFCQGFSEPGSGSDLASLKTRAVREGDHYLVNGQKMWTSNGHRADWMFALVRTDPAAKKQKGISYLLIDMKTPGLTVRPIITLDGDHHTNETFFDNVKVPVENLIGQENRGWDYAKFLLGNERAGGARVGLSKARVALAKELASRVQVDGRPLSEQPRFREKIAEIEVELKALELTTIAVVAGMKKRQGHTQDPRASILKMKGSFLVQATLELLMEIAGPHAMARQLAWLEAESNETVGPDWAGTTAGNYYFGRATSIFAGSNEIQHNIIAKNVLGL